MAVLVGVADADVLAVLQAHLPRALDLEEEELHRVAAPRDHRRGEVAARVDLRARVVGHQPPAVEASAQAQRPRLGTDGTEVDHHQVGRHAEDREAVRLARRAAAVDDRLVVAGDHPAVAAFARHHRVGHELGFEEPARRLLVSRWQALCQIADPLESSAAGDKRPQAGLELRAAPARQVGEPARLIAHRLRLWLRRRAHRAFHRRGRAGADQ